MIDCTREIIVSAIEVHRELGPGLLERVYEEALAMEMEARGMKVARQVAVPVHYKGNLLDCDLRLDCLVNDTVIVELKAVESLLPIHEAQVLTYLKVTRLQLALLLNFNVPVIKQGIKRIVYNFQKPSP